MELIGHRGAAGLEPENTILSFERAIALGAQRIETDVRLTSDGKAVLMHDDKVDRTTNGSGAVLAMTFSEIRELRTEKDLQVPTLSEALECCRNLAILHIELKAEGTAEATVSAIREAGMADQVQVISFSTEWLQKVRSLAPEIRLAKIWGEPPEDAIEEAKALRAFGISIQYPYLSIRWLREAAEAELELSVWTVNDIGDIRKIVALCPDLICSDYPGRVRDVLSQ